MKFSLGTSVTVALVASITIPCESFIPAFPMPRASGPTATVLQGIFYQDDVYVPTNSPQGLPSSAVSAMTPPSKISEGQVRALFYLWNDALSTEDSSQVASLYSKNPLLLPTVSDRPRTDFASIQDYFDHFLKLKPQGKIVEGHISIGNGWARDAGIYEFTMGVDGSKTRARYTFLYVYEKGQWKISHHHSSMMPEQVVPKPTKLATEDEIRDLFHVWNGALATLDSSAVAKCYAKNAVLLPTVSNVLRADSAGIQDYFDHFLKLLPSGRILESHVNVGSDGTWAEDSGHYEFTLGKDGSKVQARYTFIYVKEGNEWKILHHHSSAFPEPKIPPLSDEEKVRALFSKWNKALQTLDPAQVAACYAPGAVLLPTVSDVPRTDAAGIEDYFTHFLKLKPVGSILQSHVSLGKDWCQDVGLYEFALGDGKKVQARYTFLYVPDPESGEWKILHHHSSAMPEGGKQ
eukprot:Nitzschia sp. Nitz4//scaffold66_size103028//11749//13233//NITZ4_004489-RA/size103028-snap-gene-0.134-mRNA-1//-1//CDS//3329556323//1871//frame0